MDNYSEDCEYSKQQRKKNIILYSIAIVVFLVALLIPIKIVKMILFGITIALIGHKVLIEGIKNIFEFNFEEDTLMTIAIIAAFIIGEYPEACLVLFLFNIGEFLSERAMRKSYDNIEDIVSLKQNNANVVEDGQVVVKDSKFVNMGDTILIKPGEMVPLDCIIVSGRTQIDVSNITGESNAVIAKVNDHLLSGSINLSSAIYAKVEKDLNNSMVSQIVNLVEEATNNKGKSEEFITKFSKKYTPAVLVFAIIYAFITAITGMLEIGEAVRRSLIFIVAACPCSLVISVPLAFFACVGNCSKKGMLIKGTKHIESLSNANLIAFDKTGTLTTGKMKIDTIEVYGGYSQKQILKVIASLEQYSIHPIANAILEHIDEDEDELYEVQRYKEIAGYGLFGIIEGKEVVFGNEKLLELYRINGKVEEGKIYLAVGGKIIGAITLKEDVVKENKMAVYSMDLKKIMLTGDSRLQAEKIAKEYGITDVYSNLLPGQKQEIIQDLRQKGNIVIFVGDGLNDAPVIAEADFGISMGMGTEMAHVSSDAILINNKISLLPSIIELSKKTMTIVKTNIIFSLLAKAIVLILRNVRHGTNLACSTSRHRSNTTYSSKFYKNNVPIGTVPLGTFCPKVDTYLCNRKFYLPSIVFLIYMIYNVN